MRRPTFWLVLSLAMTLFVFGCGDEDDGDGGSGDGSGSTATGDTMSCALNQSDTEYYICTETTRAICEQMPDGCECSATEPNTVLEGTACPEGQDATCAIATGTFFYYNSSEDVLGPAESACVNDLAGTWTAE